MTDCVTSDLGSPEDRTSPEDWGSPESRWRWQSIAAVVLVALMAAAPLQVAIAQDAAPTEEAAPGASTEPAADPAADDAEAFRQIELSDAQMKSFLASQDDFLAVAEKIEAGGENPDKALFDELDEVAKKYGFKDHAEYSLVAANIAIVLAGFDPDTGKFQEPQTALAEELAEVKTAKDLSEDERKQLVEELEMEIKETPTITHRGNIDLVGKYRADIEKVLQ